MKYTGIEDLCDAAGGTEASASQAVTMAVDYGLAAHGRAAHYPEFR